MPFGSDEDREKEMNRLAELSDDAFAATEAAYDRAIKGKAECPCSDKADEKEQKPAASGALRTSADVRPADVDDKKLSLEDKLRQGFMTAYRERVGATSGEKN
jgi:adenine-specific DNA-methyltransferase